MSDDVVFELNEFRRKGDLKGALQMLEGFYREDCFNPSVYLELGKTLYLAGNTVDAMANFLTGLHIEIAGVILENNLKPPFSKELKKKLLAANPGYVRHIGNCYYSVLVQDPEFKDQLTQDIDVNMNMRAYKNFLMGVSDNFQQIFLDLTEGLGMSSAIDAVKWEHFPLIDANHFFKVREEYNLNNGLINEAA